MKVYLRLLRFAKPYKLYILISLVSSVLYVFTNGVTLWIIGSLLSSIMNPDAITLGGIDSFTDKINSYVFQYIQDNSIKTQLKFLCLHLFLSSQT